MLNKQEECLWEIISKGKPVDFNRASPIIFGKFYPKIPNPKNLIEWPETRTISTKFLRQVLSSLANNIQPQGVVLRGAWFNESLDLDNFDLKFPLRFIGCRFEETVSLNNLTNSKFLEFRDCHFNERFVMNAAVVTGNLSLTNSTFSSCFILRGSQIGGQLNLLGSKFEDGIDLNSLIVQGSLFLDSEGSSRTIFCHDVDLVSAFIKDQLCLSHSTFRGNLLMDSLKVGNGLKSNNASFYGDVSLANCNIRGNLDFDGSTFFSLLNLNSVHLFNDLFLRETHLNKLILTGARVKGDANFTKANCASEVIMDSVLVDQNLFIEKSAFYKSLNLNSSVIGGQCVLADSFFAEQVSLNGVKIGKGLFMQSEKALTTFKENVDLTKALINKQLNLCGARFYSALQMSSIEVRGNLHMDGTDEFYARFEDINLSGARINGQVSLCLSLINGKINMESIFIEENLFILFSFFATDGNRNDLSLLFGNIEGGFYIGGTNIHKISMVGIQIGKDFCVGIKNYPILWRGGGELDLTNSYIGAIEDSANSWPLLTHLNGFTYKRLGGFAPKDLKNDIGSLINQRNDIIAKLRLIEQKARDDLMFEDALCDYEEFAKNVSENGINTPIQERSLTWYIDWLNKRCCNWAPYDHLIDTVPSIKFLNCKNQNRYYPQPYQQLASVFQNMGKEDLANEILYVKKIEELKNEKAWTRKLLLFSQRIFVGFGYRYRFTFLWVILLTLIGTYIACEIEGNSLVMSFFFSLDNLIPVPDILDIQNRSSDQNQIVQIGSLWIVYFYIQKILGAILVLYITAALTGITKK